MTPTAASTETIWRTLAAPTGEVAEPFDPRTLDGLPAPAQRFLAGALPAGTPLVTSIELEMSGEIKLGPRWLPFTARQILRARTGFVWAATAGGRVVRFTGADVLSPAGARLDFRLHGVIPIARATGPDVARSGVGRLAAETVAWLPQALTPQSGAVWTALDDNRSVVTVPGTEDVDVEVTVDADGRLRGLRLDRWRDSARPPCFVPFGGRVDDGVTTGAGVRIAGTGVVGWQWGTAQQADGEFFRYQITATPLETAAGP